MIFPGLKAAVRVTGLGQHRVQRGPVQQPGEHGARVVPPRRHGQERGLGWRTGC